MAKKKKIPPDTANALSVPGTPEATPSSIPDPVVRSGLPWQILVARPGYPTWFAKVVAYIYPPHATKAHEWTFATIGVTDTDAVSITLRWLKVHHKEVQPESVVVL